MITHGNKQISEIVYARKVSDGGGAVRLTNIIRGAQVVFGGLKPDVKMLITVAAKAAILAAFGQTDGKAVIRATNAYLNALAATDPTKATALAGFINEDPMLVCSLGLQPQGVQMPIRWLVGDGNAYIKTNVNLVNGNNIKFGLKITKPADNSSWKLNGIAGGDSFYIGFNNNKQIYYSVSFGDTSTGYTADFSHVYDMYVDNIAGKVYAYDKTTQNVVVDRTITPISRNINRPMLIWAWATGLTAVSARFKANITDCYLYKGGELMFRFAPTIKNDVCCFIDLSAIGTERQLYFENAGSGSFTIAYTLTDGTPWTPLDQTT